MNKHAFESSIIWRGGKAGVVKMSGRPDVEFATPPDFGGPGGYWSPEDLFLASVNSCILTTFTYFAERFGILFEGYESGIKGEVELVGGKFAFTKITVTPRVYIADGAQTPKVQDALAKSEKYCLISASIKTPITVTPQIVAGHNERSIKRDV